MLPIGILLRRGGLLPERQDVLGAQGVPVGPLAACVRLGRVLPAGRGLLDDRVRCTYLRGRIGRRLALDREWDTLRLPVRVGMRQRRRGERGVTDEAETCRAVHELCEEVGGEEAESGTEDGAGSLGCVAAEAGEEGRAGRRARARTGQRRWRV